MNAWRANISVNKQSILIDFQGSINAYTGVPLTVKNDAVCFCLSRLQCDSMDQ